MCAGEWELDPTGWTDGSRRTPYPCQVGAGWLDVDLNGTLGGCSPCQSSMQDSL